MSGEEQEIEDLEQTTEENPEETAISEEELAKQEILDQKQQKEDRRLALLISGNGEDAEPLDNEHQSLLNKAKKDKAFVQAMAREGILRIISLQINAAGKYQLSNAKLRGGKALKFPINGDIFFPRLGKDKKPLRSPSGHLIGDIMTFKDGKPVSSRILKPAEGCSIDSNLLNEAHENMMNDKCVAYVKFLSTAVDNLSPLGELEEAMKNYRWSKEEEKLPHHEEMIEETRKLARDTPLEFLELLEGKGEFSVDGIIAHRDGVMQIPHLDKDGHPDGKYDTLVCKDGKIVDGVITEGSSLGADVKEKLRDAIFEKEMASIDPSNREGIEVAKHIADRASGLKEDWQFPTKEQERSHDDMRREDHNIREDARRDVERYHDGAVGSSGRDRPDGGEERGGSRDSSDRQQDRRRDDDAAGLMLAREERGGVSGEALRQDRESNANERSRESSNELHRESSRDNSRDNSRDQAVDHSADHSRDSARENSVNNSRENSEQQHVERQQPEPQPRDQSRDQSRDQLRDQSREASRDEVADRVNAMRNDLVHPAPAPDRWAADRSQDRAHDNQVGGNAGGGNAGRDTGNAGSGGGAAGGNADRNQQRDAARAPVAPPPALPDTSGLAGPVPRAPGGSNERNRRNDRRVT